MGASSAEPPNASPLNGSTSISDAVVLRVSFQTGCTLNPSGGFPAVSCCSESVKIVHGIRLIFAFKDLYNLAAL